MRRALVGTLAGPLPIANRLLIEAGLGIMVGQGLGLALRNLGKAQHQYERNTLMGLLPGALQQ